MWYHSIDATRHPWACRILRDRGEAWRGERTIGWSASLALKPDVTTGCTSSGGCDVVLDSVEASLISEILQLRGQGYGMQRISGISVRHGRPTEGDHLCRPLQRETSSTSLWGTVYNDSDCEALQSAYVWPQESHPFKGLWALADSLGSWTAVRSQEAAEIHCLYSRRGRTRMSVHGV